MPLTSLPTVADGSLGRVKADKPGSPPFDLDHDQPASEWNAAAAALATIAEEVGLTDGSTTGSLRQDLLGAISDLVTKILGVSVLGSPTDGNTLIYSAGNPPEVPPYCYWGTPDPKTYYPTATSYTTSADARVVVGSAASAQTITFDSSAPLGNARVRRVLVVYNGVGALTVKDPGGNTLVILDGVYRTAAEFVTPDGTNWTAPLSEGMPQTLTQFGVFIGRMATGVVVGSQGSCCYQTSTSSGEPEFTKVDPTAAAVAADNPIVLALTTVDGTAVANHAEVYFLARGYVQNYDVAGSPATGAAVYIGTGGRLSTTPAAVRRRVGAIVGGSGTQWFVWFDGAFVPGSSLAFSSADADGDMAYRASGKYQALGIGAAGKLLRSTGSAPAWGYGGGCRTLSATGALTAADHGGVVLLDSSGGAFDVQTPTVNPGAGWRVRVKKKSTDANAIKVARGGFGGNIEGASADWTWTLSTSADRPWVDVVSDGTDYWIC